jgi:hypothetical protein
MFVVKLSGTMLMITGGSVSLGPPVGVNVEAHLVKMATMNMSTTTTDVAIAILCAMLRRLFIVITGMFYKLVKKFSLSWEIQFRLLLNLFWYISHLSSVTMLALRLQKS